jgi:hypothetical protein
MRIYTHEGLLSLEPVSPARRELSGPCQIREGLQSNLDSDAIQHLFGMTDPAINLFPLPSFASTGSGIRGTVSRTALPERSGLLVGWRRRLY